MDELEFSNRMICPIVPAAPEPMPGVTETWAVVQGRGAGPVVLDDVDVPPLGEDVDEVDVVDCDWGALLAQAASKSARDAVRIAASTPL